MKIKTRYFGGGMRFCEYCINTPATHFCECCEHWVCDSYICKSKASMVCLGKTFFQRFAKGTR